MIFNILSRAERKRLRMKKLSRFHDWFAWYPVRVNVDEVAWLETVVRECSFTSHGRYNYYFRKDA